MDVLVKTGINLHKAIAMGLAHGKTGPGYENMLEMPGNTGAAKVREDLGQRERKPGMTGGSDRY